jgi:ENTS family enterobactin (siderophore) exporter
VAHPALWPLFLFPGLVAGLAGFEGPALGAMVPVLVGRQDTAIANATLQALFQLGGVAGPAIAGLLLAGTGPATVYWADAISFVLVALSVVGISAQPQPRSAASAAGLLPGFRRQEAPDLAADTTRYPVSPAQVSVERRGSELV